MKKITVILVLTLMSLATMAQTYPSKISLHSNNHDALSDFFYAQKAAKQEGYKLSYDQWAPAYFNGELFQKPQLHELHVFTPGDYMAKAKTNFVVGGTFLVTSFAGYIVADLMLENIDLTMSLEDIQAKINTAKTMRYIFTGTAIIGSILVITGGVNLGKAGILLNENGVGVSVKL